MPPDTAAVRCIHCGKEGTHRVCDECFKTQGSAAAHEHEWHDTGFSDLDECACGATRSATTGQVMTMAPCPICGAPTIPVGERTGPKGMDFTPEVVHAAHVKADEWREAFGWKK